MKCGLHHGHIRAVLVAPPRGERGLKSNPRRERLQQNQGRSPSWGAWIEIRRGLRRHNTYVRRSPSWGAWIEISSACARSIFCFGRSPSWGAWIEILFRYSFIVPIAVAPPRGERGLKWYECQCGLSDRPRRSPSWGAWIEISWSLPQRQYQLSRRSPSWGAWIEINLPKVNWYSKKVSLPLVGSVD